MKTALTLLVLLALTGLIPTIAVALGWGAVLVLAVVEIAAWAWLCEHDRHRQEVTV